MRNKIGPLVAGLEILIGIGLLIFPTFWPLGLAAIVFLIAFSVFLARAGSLANGCGCWRPARRGGSHAAPYLIRNTFLIILSALAGIRAYHLGVTTDIAIIAVSLIPAWLIMEVPSFAELLSSPDRRPRPARIEGRS